LTSYINLHTLIALLEDSIDEQNCFCPIKDILMTEKCIEIHFENEDLDIVIMELDF